MIVEAWWPSGLGNYFVCKRFAVQTILWSLEFVIQINLKHNTIAVMIVIFSIDLYSTKCNTFILKSFMQFTCTNLDGYQKHGGNFFNLLQKEGGTQKEGGEFPHKKWGSKPGGNYAKRFFAEINC